MGNCLVLEEKVVKVMKTDWKILEYKQPIKVHQVLSEFSHHAISDTLQATKHMHPDDEMLPSNLYYLLRLPAPIRRKVVRFSDDDGGRVVRIKLVISKKELQRLLSKGEVSVDDIIPKVQREESTNAAGSYERDGEVSVKGWSPALECIPEIN